MLTLPGSVHVAPDRHQLYEDLGDILLASAMEAVRERGVFHLALSGGSTPERFYMSLVIDPRYRAFPWLMTHVWVVDERRVPEDSEQSNIRMIRESLLDQTTIRSRQVHPIPVMAGDPALEYEATFSDLMDTAENRPPRMDFILLGMGDDCHTASLFPNSAGLAVEDRWVVVNDGPNVTPPDRVTMTYPMINAARSINVLVTGEKKTEALRRVAALERPDVQNVPVSGIRPAHDDGDLAWYLDNPAAGLPEA